MSRSKVATITIGLVLTMLWVPRLLADGSGVIEIACSETAEVTVESGDAIAFYGPSVTGPGVYDKDRMQSGCRGQLYWEISEGLVTCAACDGYGCSRYALAGSDNPNVEYFCMPWGCACWMKDDAGATVTVGCKACYRQYQCGGGTDSCVQAPLSSSGTGGQS